MFAAAVFLTLLLAVFRVVIGFQGVPDTTATQWLHNFSPLASVALCGGMFLPRAWRFALPLGVLFISDLVLNARYGVSLVDARVLPQYGVLTLICWMGLALRKNGTLPRIFLGSVLASILFYLVSNSVAWLLEPAYPRTFAGLGQALTNGLPGYSPTWVFFRNSLVSDLLFTGLFVLCMSFRPASEGRPVVRSEVAGATGT